MKLEGEIWKSVAGYEGIYEVSNFGRVKSLSREKKCGHPGAIQITKERILRISEDRFGYKRVKLSKNGKTKLAYLHRILGIAFIENPLNKKEINHIDGDKGNFSLENLEWCNRKENIRHAWDNGLCSSRKGEKNNLSKLKETEIKEIRELREKGLKLVEISKIFNVTQANISEIVNFKTWKEVR